MTAHHRLGAFLRRQSGLVPLLVVVSGGVVFAVSYAGRLAIKVTLIPSYSYSFISLSLSPFILFFLCLSLSVSVCLCLSLSVSFSLSMCSSVSVSPFLSLSIYLLYGSQVVVLKVSSMYVD